MSKILIDGQYYYKSYQLKKSKDHLKGLFQKHFQIAFKTYHLYTIKNCNNFSEASRSCSKKIAQLRKTKQKSPKH